MEELQELRRRMEEERPTPWNELPDIALYMDQLVSYLPRQLIRVDDSAPINYIKDGLVPRAEGKRYGPTHLGYLTAVAALKQVLSVREIGTLLDAARARNKPPEELYAYFCRALDQALAETARAIDPDTPQEGLAGLALELALRSYADQLACQRILSILHPPEEKGKRRKEP